MAVMVVVGMAFIFTLETPEFWENSPTPPPDLNPLFFLVPFITCLIFISIYPLIDFLFIAFNKNSEEGFTPFHKLIGRKIINISNKKNISVIIAITFYFGVFLLPPLILSLFGLPLIMLLISWMLVYPLIILTFYGSKGYIAGIISNCYLAIPDVKRSIFLNFEDSKRGMKQFASDPGPYILLGLMLFVYFWAWFSMIQTIAFFFTGIIAISTMTSYFVFVTLFLGVTGYFTRYFGRQVQFRGFHLFFAAYLMAAIGVNVLVNFLIVNPEKMLDTFNSLDFTSQIVPNYKIFAWTAAIEEIVLIFFTTYYFLTKKNKFKENIMYSKITKCGQTFDPVPLFNLIKSSNQRIQQHAEQTLILMFERIPLKSEIDLNKWKFKDSLIDGICDPNSNSKRISYHILVQLERNVPVRVIPWIIEALESPNYDKSIPIARSLLRADINLVEKIPLNIILNLIEDSEWRLKSVGLRIFSRLIQKNKDIISNLNVKKLVNDSNSKIQVEVLNLLSNTYIDLPVEILINKLNHSNKEVRAAAIRNMKNLQIKDIDEKIISEIMPLMEDPTGSVRASIFEFFAKIGNFKKFKIPLSPFFDGLTDSNKDVRLYSVLALEKFFNEQPDVLNLEMIINKIVPSNKEALNSILSLLGKLWEKNPEKILKTLLSFITFENNELKENISKILVDKYENNSDLILQNLMTIPDVSRFITKGIVSRTIIKIGKNDPLKVIPILINFLGSKNNDVVLNAVNSLDGLVDEYFEKIDIKPLLLLLERDSSKQIKKEALNVISKIAKKDPMTIKPVVSEILQTINDQEISVKIVLIKSILEISMKSPEFISIDPILSLLADQDSFIRETSVKILGFIGFQFLNKVIDQLINNALNDEEWIVREAAVSSLGNIIKLVENKNLVIEKLVTLLDDEQVWVRRSAMNMLSNIKEVTASQIPFEKVFNNLSHEDNKVREASAGLLKIYSYNHIDRIFDKILLLLEDDVEDVRRNMINTMVEIIQNIGLSKIFSKLLKNLSDEGSIELQRSIALILGRTAKYEDEKIKKRAISLLKIRCEMSQDPIICKTLQALRET